MPDEIMTLSEVADYLKVAEKTVQRMIGRAEIPCAKVGGQWRFMRRVIDQWLIGRMGAGTESATAAPASRNASPPLSELTRRAWILPELEPGEPRELLDALIAPWCAEGIIQNRAAYLNGLLARESMTTTVIGEGIAVPHLRQPDENPAAGPLLAIGRCPAGTTFGTSDDSIVHLFFLPMTRSEVVHVRLLAQLARLARQESFRHGCLTATSAADLLEHLILHERQQTNPTPG